ncbi:MAG TPA: GatB/YqeY domain-containing protein [Candidatus Margulisiibacteriota bacterium]|nr:GatB/YqeY domain-containing protein [Candidatus Margulisiibacteriota bacterium]
MLEEKIMNDYKEAMKARDALKSSVLNFLRAEINNVAIAKKKNKLEDPEIISVIRKQIKERQDSIEQFNKGNRQDLADKEGKELALLKGYLPPELPEEEIKKIIEEVIIATGAAGIKDMGKVMKEVTAKTGSQADGKTVSNLVRERLLSAH